jgi:hypothetical protein
LTVGIEDIYANFQDAEDGEMSKESTSHPLLFQNATLSSCQIPSLAATNPGVFPVFWVTTASNLQVLHSFCPCPCLSKLILKIYQSIMFISCLSHVYHVLSLLAYYKNRADQRPAPRARRRAPTGPGRASAHQGVAGPCSARIPAPGAPLRRR